jgi:hypothetical protein
MRMTAILTQLSESGRTGLSAALKNGAAGPGCCGFAAQSAHIRAFQRQQTTLGERNT